MTLLNCAYVTQSCGNDNKINCMKNYLLLTAKSQFINKQIEMNHLRNSDKNCAQRSSFTKW